MRHARQLCDQRPDDADSSVCSVYQYATKAGNVGPFVHLGRTQRWKNRQFQTRNAMLVCPVLFHTAPVSATGTTEVELACRHGKMKHQKVNNNKALVLFVACRASAMVCLERLSD